MIATGGGVLSIPDARPVEHPHHYRLARRIDRYPRDVPRGAIHGHCSATAIPRVPSSASRKRRDRPIRRPTSYQKRDGAHRDVVESIVKALEEHLGAQ